MEPLKNMLGVDAAHVMAKALVRANRSFSSDQFLDGIEDELQPLELKERMQALTDRMAVQFATDPSVFSSLIHALQKNAQDKTGLHGFVVWPLTNFVARYGLGDVEASMKALKEMTKVFTAEFAVRPFFIAHERQMLRLFSRWANDENEHVRRLVSEGSRPLLPWGQKLPRFLEDPELTWPLLFHLKNDSSRYVQKSVANHLNDLSKHHDDWVVKKTSDWSNPWLVRHALRTLIKNGHRGALERIGVNRKSPIVKKFILAKKRLHIGESLVIILDLQNPGRKSMRVTVDTEVFFLKANGKKNPKVFKGKVFDLGASERREIQIVVPIKRVTTRRYYPGPQAVRPVINGYRNISLHDFSLKC